MSEKKMIAGEMRDVDWSERRDNGGMFDSTVGVYHDEQGRYFAFILDWGSGVKSPAHPSLDEARVDIERLWTKMYG